MARSIAVEPGGRPAAQQYVRAAADWTRRDPGASFHRIIGVPAQEPGKSAMRLWLREHYEETRGLANRHARVEKGDGSEEELAAVTALLLARRFRAPHSRQG